VLRVLRVLAGKVYHLEAERLEKKKAPPHWRDEAGCVRKKG